MSSSIPAFLTVAAISTCSPSTRNNLQTIFTSGSPSRIAPKNPAEIVLLPTLWFRNTWVWGCSHEGCSLKPRIWRDKEGWIQTEHETLEPMYLFYDATDEFLFTENETNFQRLYGSANYSPFVKDSFHTYIVSGDKSSTNQDFHGTKVAPVYRIKLAAEESRTVYLRLVSVAEWDNKPQADSAVFDLRKSETDEFYEHTDRRAR